MHIGSLRTALFNYLYAKQNDGDFLLRIEDTDRSRLVPGAEENMIEILNKMGLNPDGKIEKQSDRLKKYNKAAEKLIKEKKAYYCFCSSERLDELRKGQQANKQVPKYDRHCCDLSEEDIDKKLKEDENHVIRFKIPDNEIIKAEDMVYGKISVKSEDLDDLVILKSDGYPTYHLANILDDHEMKVTHVIRGEEWLPSLPKHILLYRAFDYDLPTFVHLPLLLNPDKSKLSKRQGDVAVEDFLAKGYLKEVLINYVAMLGWNPGDDREIFSLEELIKEFSIANINKAGAVFDINKLNWYNSEYVRQIIENKDDSYKTLLNTTAEFLTNFKDRPEDVLKLFGSRVEYLAQLDEMTAFLHKLPRYETEELVFKKSDLNKTKQGMKLAYDKLETTKDKDWEKEFLHTTLENLVNNSDFSPGDIFWPLRIAVSGLQKSPSPAEIMDFLGKEESLNRIKQALDKLG
jgi:glutamyl-tRNA synthetase